MSGFGNDDPTCVRRMLEDFRSGTTVSRLKSRRSCTASVSTRLKFDSPLLDRDINNKRPRSDGSYSSLSSSTKKFKDDSLNDSDTNNDLEFASDATESPWESRRLRSELVDARTEIGMLEGRIKQLHAARVELEVAFDGEKHSLLELQDRDREKIRELEKKIKVMRRREIDARDELQEQRKTSDALRFKLETTLQALRKENEDLRDRLRDVEMDSHKSQVSSDFHVQELESDLKHTREEVEELKKRCSHLEERASESMRQQLASEQQAFNYNQTKLELNELKSELERGREVVAAVQAQHHKLLLFPELEQQVTTLKEELAHLREAVPNKLLLEEMVQDLKKRLSHMEELERDLAKVESARDLLESSLSEWLSVAREHCAADPAALRHTLGELQQRVLVCTDELAEARSQLKQSESARQAAVFKLETMKNAEEKQRQHTEQQTQLVRRLQKKLLLITRERDSYRSQLDSYEKDLTMTSSLSGSNVQQLRSRVETLERTLEGYRDMVERLEAELGTTGTASLLERLQRVETERDGLLLEKERLMERRDELERQLEHRALQGDYDPGTSKLLHFRQNPAAEAEAQREAEIEALKKERDRLAARVALLEEMGSCPDDLTQQVQDRVTVASSQQVQELQEQVKSGELKLQRFMEVFKTTIREFREVCYMLLGYKVDRMENNHYKVTSMYAQSTDDHLMFKVMPTGEVNLLETEFSSSLVEHIEKYLHQQNSFPMFLSAVNMDLFQAQIA